MKLLFSTNEAKSSQEIKQLMGYVDADLKLKNLKPDIKTATYNIVSLVGKEVYDFVADLYTETLAANDEDFNYNLMQSVRYPILVNAYMLYAPSNDLSHTNAGRKMRNEDFEKNAFDWMIDRDNKAQEKRYYRALDDLIKFLDNSEEDSDELWALWKSSDAYKKSQKLFIRTTDDFNEFFQIESRFLLLKLAPGLQFCETREILPRLGKTKFDELKEKLKNHTEISEIDLQLIHLIKEATAAYSLAWAIPRMSIQIFPEGILQSYTSDRMSSQASKSPMLNESEGARQAFMTTFSRVAIDIEQLLKPPPVISIETPLMPRTICGDKYLST